MEFNVNNIDFEIFGENGLTNRTKCYVSTCNAGVKGAQPPFKKYVVIPRQRPQTAWLPKNLVTTELFLGRRGAGDVVCTAPTQLKVYEYENHYVKI